MYCNTSSSSSKDLTTKCLQTDHIIRRTDKNCPTMPRPRTIRLLAVASVVLVTLMTGQAGAVPVTPSDSTAPTTAPASAAVPTPDYQPMNGRRLDNLTAPLTNLSCRVLASGDELNYFVQIQSYLSQNAKLITYMFNVLNYSVNPLTENNTFTYRLDKWSRTASSHGETILSLAFNFDLLSLYTLVSGVELMHVNITDEPQGCLGQLKEEQKVEVMLDLLLRDLKNNGPVTVAEGGDNVCYQMIKMQNGYSNFANTCCYRRREFPEMRCFELQPNNYLRILDILLAALNLVVFVFGPVLMPDWLYTSSVDNHEYEVILKESLYKKLVVCRQEQLPAGVKADHVLDLRDRKDFVVCRRIVNQLPSDVVIPIKISRFDIMVNYKKLLEENHIPVSLTESITRALFLCKLRDLDAFRECCDANIFSTWCMKEQRPRKWIGLCNFVGKALLVLLMPLPFYLRVLAFYIRENVEINNRTKAAENFGYPLVYNYRLLQYLTPTHPTYLISYIVYFAVGMAFAYLSGQQTRTRFQTVITDSFEDMKNLSWLNAVTMVIKNFLWPFQKFGVLGIFLGIIWWPLILPISLLACIIYCLPLVFLTCRILLHTFRDPDEEELKPKEKRQLSRTVRKFEMDALFDKLDPKGRYFQRARRNCYCVLDGKTLCKKILVTTVAMLTIYSLMLMFAEVFSFLAEVACFTLMGVIVNATKILKYGTLIFLVLVYSHDTFGNVNKRYLKLNKTLFSEIKQRIGKDIDIFTSQPSWLQGNRGFKSAEASQQADYETTDDIAEEDQHSWNINDLVLFIDKEDRPRIPKKLFDDVCAVRVAGSPGPVYQSLLTATSKFLVILLFIMFVFIVVGSFGESYKVNQANQMMATMAGGFMPLIFRHALKPMSADIETNLVSFRSKLEEIIKSVCQAWPMLDFQFEVEEKPEPNDGDDKGDDKDKKPDDKGGDKDKKDGGGATGGKDDKDKRDKPNGDAGGASSKDRPKDDGKKDAAKDDQPKTETETKNLKRAQEREFLRKIKANIEDLHLLPSEGSTVDIILHVRETDEEWLMEHSSASDIPALTEEYKMNGTMHSNA